MIFVDEIKKFLAESGMTREEFAKKADIPLSTLNTLLKKDDPNPSYMTTMKVAQAANISLDAIGGIISNDMGAEEIARIKKAYSQNEEKIKKTIAEYAAKIAEQEKTEAHDKEIIRRQDLRMQEQLDRISYQKRAIFLLRLGLAAAILYAVLLDALSPAIGFIQY